MRFVDYLRNARSSRRVLLLAFVVVLPVALTFVARAYTRRASEVAKPDTRSAPVVLVQPSSGSPLEAQSREERIEVEEVVVRPTGFDPPEITRPVGRFILVVSSPTIPEDLDLRLDREAGGRLHQVRLPRGNRHCNESFELHPGRYVLTEANHPDWVCRITIR